MRSERPPPLDQGSRVRAAAVAAGKEHSRAGVAHFPVPVQLIRCSADAHDIPRVIGLRKVRRSAASRPTEMESRNTARYIDVEHPAA